MHLAREVDVTFLPRQAHQRSRETAGVPGLLANYQKQNGGSVTPVFS